MQASKLSFSAAGLFYFMTFCATATSLFGWLGVPVGCFVMLIWVQILAGVRREQAAAAEQAESLNRLNDSGNCPARTVPWRAGVGKLELVVVLLIAALVVGLLMPAAHDFDPQRQAETSMKMVAKAVQAYQQHFGAWPPSQLVSEDGTPLHSWRALILPYLGEEKLAAAYRWDEPWNGPNNALLAKYRPWHYCTYYPHSEARRNTTAVHLLHDYEGQPYVVEHEQAECNWLEPTQRHDWRAFDTIPAEDQGFWQHGFFSSWYRGRLAVTSDRSLRLHPSEFGASALPESIAQPDLSRGQSQRELRDVGEPYRQVHWDNGLRLGLFLLIAIYPLRWLTRK